MRSKDNYSWEGVWEPYIYSQLVVSTGYNLELVTGF